MRLVIIESPYKGDVARNELYLRSCIRDCIMRSESPYASHRMLTDALDDNDPKERQWGIEAGLQWRHAIYQGRMGLTYVTPIFYVDLGWSNGMLYAKKTYDAEGVAYEERRLAEDDVFFNTRTALSDPCPGCGH